MLKVTQSPGKREGTSGQGGADEASRQGLVWTEGEIIDRWAKLKNFQPELKLIKVNFLVINI